MPAPWWGWVFLTAVLAVRAIAYEWNSRWLETATLLPAIACLTWTFGSWPLLRRIWPAIIFLVFLLPLPPVVNDLIALPLQGYCGVGQLLSTSTFGVLGDSRGECYSPHDASWPDTARRGPRM